MLRNPQRFRHSRVGVPVLPTPAPHIGDVVNQAEAREMLRLLSSIEALLERSVTVLERLDRRTPPRQPRPPDG